MVRVSTTVGSPTSTKGRPVSPTIARRSRNPVSPRSPSHHGDDKHSHPHRSHYESRDHQHHRLSEPHQHLQSNISEYYTRSLMGSHHHHTVHHHHQPRLQVDTRDAHRHSVARDSVSRSPSASPGGSPRAIPHPARPTPIHPAVAHASSSTLTSPSVQDIYGSLTRSSDSEPGVLAVPPTVPPSVTHGVPTLSMMYDPVAAATLASPYLQAPVGAYPAPAVYSLPPYTRPEHYAFLARHHPCKF